MEVHNQASNGIDRFWVTRSECSKLNRRWRSASV